MDTSFGIQQKGKRNLITDVAGITVGHCTLATAAPPRST